LEIHRRKKGAGEPLKGDTEDTERSILEDEAFFRGRILLAIEERGEEKKKRSISSYFEDLVRKASNRPVGKAANFRATRKERKKEVFKRPLHQILARPELTV